MNKPRVFLAGKVGKNDWREQILGGRVADMGALPDGPGQLLFDPDYDIEHDHFIYTGPYMLGDDHGCFHGPEAHGLGIGAGMSPCVHEQVQSLVATAKAIGSRNIHEALFQAGRERLKRSDLVFAWVDDLTCYGTLIEIAMANAFGVPVGLRLPSPAPMTGPVTEFDIDRHFAGGEFWMARQAATAVYFGGTPATAWDWFRNEFIWTWQPRQRH